MRRVIFLILLVLIQLTIIAHEGKHDKKVVKRDTLTIVGKDTIAINGKAINKSFLKQKMVDKKELDFEISLSDELASHLHNKIVHFPIAIGVFAFFLSFLNFKWKIFDSAILISVLVAFLFSIVAFITGTNQAHPFAGSSKEWIVELHQKIGIALVFNLFIWLFFLATGKLKKYAWIIRITAFLIILIAGFLGGVIAH